jgi:type IV pilus assembly protein PilZ
MRDFQSTLTPSAMASALPSALPSAFAPSGPGRTSVAATTGAGGAPAGSQGQGVTAPSPARPSVIQLVFREKGALYAAYIPAFTEGGLFVPTTREYRLGDDIYLLLSLPDDTQRHPVAGKIAWITPTNASGGRTQGVGVKFPNDEKTRALRFKIEQILGTSISSAKPTQTL